ncbi:MAG: tetratricopeptide repeat protein [Chloroflexi bacterium]|nr:tetratricopeptide repeat protein [Chloroflexota bacterium]
MSSYHIIQVTEADYQYEVVSYSSTVPVIVDVWAEWSQTSKALSLILEKLAQEAKGAFRLARVNSDENKNLIMRMNITNLPTVFAYFKGELANSFNGIKSEKQIRDFLQALVNPKNDLMREKGLGLLSLKRWEEAIPAFQKSLKSDPDNSIALLGLAKSLIAQNKPSDALVILNAFPSSKEYQSAEKLVPLALSMTGLSMDDETEEDDLGIMFRQSIHLIGLGNINAGLDGLLDVLRTDRNYKDDELKKLILGVLELMPPSDPEIRSYRNELASILF